MARGEDPKAAWTVASEMADQRMWSQVIVHCSLKIMMECMRATIADGSIWHDTPAEQGDLL